MQLEVNRVHNDQLYVYQRVYLHCDSKTLQVVI